MFKTRLISAIIFTQAIFLALPMTGCTPAEYDIETGANPEEAGEVTGTGTYQENEEVALKAEPEDGYKFDYWELEGEEVSTEQEYTFNAEGDHRFTAHFSEAKYEVKAEIDPEGTGEVTGTGTYQGGEIAILKAEAEEYYRFDHWTLEGEEVSADESYVLYVENDTRLTAHFSEDKPTLLLDKAKEALKEEKWEEAGKHLAEAKELPEAEEAFYQFFEGRRSIEHVSSILRDGKVVTAEEVSKDLEKIDELAPQKPKIEILNKEPEDLYNWFAVLREWRVRLQRWRYSPSNNQYMNTFIHEDGIQEIRSRSEQYLEKPVEVFYSKWDINDTALYYPYSPSTATWLSERRFHTKNTHFIDAKAEEDKVYITLELKETFDAREKKVNGDIIYDLKPGEEWQLIFDIHKKDDDTFRVGDYAIKDLQKDEIVKRFDIASCDHLR